MSQWTIGGTLVDVLKVTLGLAQTDSAEVEYRGADAPGITDGEWVTLSCDGAPVLYGRATVRPLVTGRRDAVRISINGPWELMEATAYQQTTKMRVSHAVDPEHPYGYALSDVLTPEVLLGMDDDGEARTTLQEAQAIMTYAAAAGIPVSFSAGFTGMAMQPVPADGSSCAACLLTVLRFHPDVLLWFDYSGGGAVLMATPAAEAEIVNFSGGPSGAHRIREAEFSPVLNYAPAGVRILYQRISADGRLEVHSDTAGTIGSAGRAPNVINWLVKLEGSTPPPVQTQRIRTRPIPRSDDPAHPEEDETELKTNWWQSRLPWLRLPGVADIVTISEHLVTVDPADVTPSEDDDEDIPVTWSTDPDDYPRELIDGTITEWMPKTAAPLTISAVFALGDTTGLSDEIKGKLEKAFSGETTTYREAQVTGTDANTREYSALSSMDGPPGWPAGGIAAAYLQAFTAQAWQGTLTLTGEDQPQVSMGRKINLSGYASEWAGMNAVIRSIGYSSASHETTITCGPPDNFGFGDFYELQRTMREAAGTDARAAAERRTLAMPNAGGRIRGAGMTANRSVSGPGGGSTGTLVPWQCERAGDFILKVWPAPMFDGRGHNFWPTIGMTTTAPETPYTFEFAEDAGDGNLYVECTVDDTDEVHGLITAAALKLDFDTHEFNELESGKVKILICQVESNPDGFVFFPLRSFALCLRRFGIPGSGDWDVTML